MLRLIEAEELKHILNNSKYYGTKVGNAFADMITECKTIEGRKKGKWVAQKGGGYRCSECKHYALDERDVNLVHVSAKTKFCPYCGADMREEKTDEIR